MGWMNTCSTQSSSSTYALSVSSSSFITCLQTGRGERQTGSETDQMKVDAQLRRYRGYSFHTVHLPCNLITDERASPPEHRQVLLLLRQRDVAAVTVSVLQLDVFLGKKTKNRSDKCNGQNDRTDTQHEDYTHFLTVVPRVCVWADFLLLSSVC